MLETLLRLCYSQYRQSAAKEITMKSVPIKYNPNYILYEDGRVYSKYKSMFMATWLDTSKYMVIGLSIDCKKSKFLLHRLLAEHFVHNPDPEKLVQVNHIDGNKLNNDISNLEWVTAGDNQRHAYETGLKTIPCGEENGRAILTENQVREIYILFLNGVSNIEISNIYGVEKSTIFGIKSKKNWLHVTKDLPDINIKPKPEKLTEDKVHEVCKLLVKKMQHKNIAEVLGITKHQVADISRKRCFKWISDNYEW